MVTQTLHTLKTGYTDGNNIGLSCPHCSTRQYPKAEADTVVRCQICNRPFRVPKGYLSRLPEKIKDKSDLLTKKHREQGLALQVENGDTAILSLDGKELKRWRKGCVESLEQVHKEIDALFMVRA